MLDAIFTLRAVNQGNPVRHETVDGRDYLVSPTIAIVAGVLNGELAPADEIAAAGSTWNGIPVPIGHPMVNGKAVSANSPDVLSKCPGRFYGAVNGDSLRGEIWIDLEAAARIGGDAMLAVQRLENGEPFDVSTGYFRQVEPVKGTWNGTPYDGVQRNIKPDHLAILLDERGACDWRMGCGTPRINHLEDLMSFQTVQINMELSLDDQMSKVYSAFSEKYNHSGEPEAPGEERQHYYVREMFADRLIASGAGKLWQLSYNIDEQGAVTFGDPAEVEIVYQPVATPATNADAAECPCKNKRPGVLRMIWQKLVGNAAETVQETPPAGETGNDGDAEATPEEAVVANQETDVPDPVPTQEAVEAPEQPAPAINQLLERLSSLESAFQQLQANAAVVPPDLSNEERSVLVAELVSNQRNTLSEAELSEMSVNALRALQSAYQPTSYAGRPVPQAETRGKTVMAMPKLD